MVEIGTRVEHVGRFSDTVAEALLVRDRRVDIADPVVAFMNSATCKSIVLQPKRQIGWRLSPCGIAVG
jgi:hypothetical protein